MSAPVMVGVDGSEDSMTAVDFAAAEARLRERPLLIAHSLVLPLATSITDARYGSATLPVQVADTLRADARILVDAVVTRASQREPGLTIVGEVIESITSSAALIDRSGQCELVVMGCRGLGGFTGLLLGSTSAQVATYAACPVVVVRPVPDEPGPYAGQVVVGVDNRASSLGALDFAFADAARRGTGLVAVHVARHPDSEFAAATGDVLPEYTVRHPQVKVTTVVAAGKPREVLRELSAGAALLVVGTRGRGGFTGMILGSTSQAMLHHAQAPVAVIR